MLEGIIVVVVGAAVIGIVTWLIRSRFLLRPKVRIAYARGGGKSAAGTDSELRLTWCYSLSLTNVTKHDALNLQVIHASDHVLSRLPLVHLKGLADSKIEAKLSKLVDRNTVVRAGHDFHGKLHPPELRDITICLGYQNETGFRFYTLYKKKGDLEENSYHFGRPQLATS
jgi:hypothetical protein